MLKGVLYLRVSTGKQVEGASLESQEDVGRKYFKQQNIELVNVFIEKGESAKYEDRTELQKAIKFCAKEKIDIMAFYKFDRYSRNVLSHLHLKAILSRYGTKIVSVTEPIPDNAAGRFMETVIAAANQFDNELKSERVVDTMKHLLNQGYWLFSDPIGYKKPGIPPDKTNKDYLIPKPNEYFEPIKEAWTVMKTGLVSQAAVVNKLNIWGVRTPFGNKITDQLGDKIFSNIFYAGIIESDKLEIRSKGKHIPATTEGDFYIVQNIKKMASRKQKHNIHNPDFPLNKSFKCPSCERFLTGCWSTGKMGKKYGYYKCYYKYCEQKSNIRKETLEEAFILYLDSFKFSDEFKELFSELYYEVASKDVNEKIELQRVTQANVTKIKVNLQRLDELLESGTYSAEKYNERRIELESRLVTEQTKLSDIQIDTSEEVIEINLALNYLQHLSKLWISLPVSNKQKLVQYFFPQGLVFKNNIITTPEKSILLSLEDTLQGGDLPLVTLSMSIYNSVKALLNMTFFIKSLDPKHSIITN